MAAAAAAADSPRKRLRDEVTCSICLDFFTEPVTIDCGHNFCHPCLERYWRNSPTGAACPECREKVRKRSLKPNRLLANMVEIAKEMKPEQGGGEVCKRHQEPLNLFCKVDEAPVCDMCERSKEHRAHNVVLVQEAAQEYKDRICRCLESLRKEKVKILACRADTEKESQALLDQMEAGRKKTVVQFQQLRQFLEEQEKLLLVQMDEVEKEIARTRDEHLAKISEELSSLERTMQEMEEKIQLPASELLQDIRSTLKRFGENKFEKSAAFSVALKWRTHDTSDINLILEVSMKQFQEWCDVLSLFPFFPPDTLVSGLQLKEANVSLDPYTAHPCLILSEDHKSAKLGWECQNLLNYPERFDIMPFVLGHQGFTAGRHFWEVVVGNEGQWSVGVARKSVRRKGLINICPEEGMWVIGKWGGEYIASRLSHSFPLSMREELKRIRVSLNYGGGRVSFYDADTADLIFAYPAAPFSGDTLLPLFGMWEKSQLTLSP
ncbi:tripartite motif-containing protein 10-like [Elgaria multicarinata webbii]|uniref:tripartite motif-containing protein 10-like n=1 Tax=Elgaria multicarinata webbii TaxID=159646 RepID=UPI002FCCD2C4